MSNLIRESKLAEPLLQECPRCAYSLRGLPTDHTCPECGLAYDEDCEFYPTIKPKRLIFQLSLLIGLGLILLPSLRHFGNFMMVSSWLKLKAIAAVLWWTGVLQQLWLWAKSYRAGTGVAVTSDGLFIGLSVVRGELVPWANIHEATVTRRPESLQDIACVKIKDRLLPRYIGESVRVFPTRADVERFVAQVNARVEASREPRDDIKPR